MQVDTADTVIEIEQATTWQKLAPQKFMILPKCRAVRIRVPSRCVGPEIKRSVDQHASSPVYLRPGRSPFAFNGAAPTGEPSEPNAAAELGSWRLRSIAKMTSAGLRRL